MKICLIGLNLTNLILAAALAEKKLDIDIYTNEKAKKFKGTRALAISAENFKYLKSLSKLSFPAWKISEIKIFVEKSKKKEILNFKKKNKESFSLISQSKLNNLFLNKIKKSNNIKIKKFNLSNSMLFNQIKKYDLVLNSEDNNVISKKYFTNKIKKNYRSYAYTFIINHKKVANNIASQIFTKYGPLAFLPVSNKNTSIVFSYKGGVINDNQILSIFKNYNFLYSLKKIGDIQKFGLNFSMLRKYTFNNVLAFGELLHRIHPLAGQGFNMTLRDIKILIKIIDNKISLGLPIDVSVAHEFQKSTKHLNYLYGKSIDAIYEFFNIDNKFNNSFSGPILNLLNRNSIFKKYTDLLSDKGFNL